MMQGSFLCFLLMFSSLSFSSKAQLLKIFDETPEIIRDPATVTKQWEDLERIFKKLMNDGVKLVMPLIMDDMQATNISSTCIKETMHVIGGMRKLKPWAMRFFDSTAKGLDGALSLSLYSYGSYDECVDTVAINERSGKQKGEKMFTGKYCIVRIKPPLPPKRESFRIHEVMTELKSIYEKGTMLSRFAEHAPFLYYVSIQMGLCIPSGCSVDDINQVLSKVADYTHLYLKVKRCEVKEEIKFTPIMIFVISLYSFAGFMVLVGTLIDLYCYYGKTKLTSKTARILLAFSFMTNFRKFVDTSSSSKELSCLNGIRFLSMSWIILCHSYLMSLYRVVSSYEYVLHMAQDWAVQVLLNGFMGVETFFFLGGFLVCYVSSKHVIVGKGNFSVKMYIFHRLWRILPVYIFAILFVFLMQIMGTGPIAYEMLRPLVEGCEENWWTNLLFINNYYVVTETCFPHGWYLAVDMQLYIGALIILLPLFRWRKVGIGIAVTLTVAFMVLCGVLTSLWNLPPTPVVTNPSFERVLSFGTDLYIKPYSHAASYITGILAGYLLAVKPNLKIPTIVQLVGWCTAITFSISIIYGPYEWNTRREPTSWETILYGSCHRFAWTLSVAWMVVCCATGHGGVVNYILSWKMWIPLGRLSFIAYLAHPLVQLAFMAIVRNALAPLHVVGVWLFFGHLMATYGIAFACSMLIESPLLSIEKIILPRPQGEKQNKTPNDVNHSLNIIDVGNGKDADSTENSHIGQPCKGTENPGFVCRL